MQTKIFVALIAAVLISGCTAYGGSQTTATTSAATATTASETTSANTVEITSAGFSPGTLTIKAGDTVTFMNMDTAEHRPASGVHPTHAAYPEPGGCIGSMFDACKNLASGESWSFTFTHVGSWKYHDHLNPSMTGTIVVQ